MENVTSQDVLEFWFSSAQKSRWYAKDEKFDADIRQRFLTTYEAAYAGELDKWRSTPESLLALIILLDQFPRNMFRGSPRAFASDAYAVRLTKEGIERGFHGSLRGAQLDFFFMPLMHSESLTDHDLLARLGYGGNRYARQHRKIIARFGRFPHRNEMLGRESTAERGVIFGAVPPLFLLQIQSLGDVPLGSGADIPRAYWNVRFCTRTGHRDTSA